MTETVTRVLADALPHPREGGGDAANLALRDYATLMRVASRALVSTSAPVEAMANVARALVPTLADGLALMLVSEDGVGVDFAAAHVNVQEEGWLRAFALEAGRDAMVSGRPRIVLEGRKAPGHEGLPPHAVIPLLQERGTLGALTVVSGALSDRALDVDVVRELAANLVLSLEHRRALRHVEEEQAKTERALKRTARLYAVTSALADAVTYATAAASVVEEGLAALDADTGALARLVDHGRTLEMVHAVGVPAPVLAAMHRLDVEAQTPAGEAARGGTAIFVESIADREARYPHLQEMHERMGNGAFAAVPLIAKGQVLAVIGFTFTKARKFCVADRGFIVALAQQCAQAFDRAHLFEELNAALLARDETLAIVSHDLRNPLYAIRIGAEVLTRSPALASRPSDERVLRSILRGVDRMDGLITALVDAAKIDAGGLSLELAPWPVADLLAELHEMMTLRATDGRIKLTLERRGDLGTIHCDREKVFQALGNLVGNALKFTPPGGHVELEGDTDGPEVKITVRDSGPGIALDDLPHIFDRYWQAPATARQGSGLGLAIAKGVVDAHGGRIAAESVAESGATFHVWLKRGGP